MKKIIAIMLTVITVLSLSITSFSAAETVNAEYGLYDTQTDIYYEAYSIYTVTVPTSLQYGEMGEVIVGMDDVAENRAIRMYITNLDNNHSISLYKEKGNLGTANGSVYVRVNGNPCESAYEPAYVFSPDLVVPGTQDVMTNISFDIAQRPTKAGMYEGTICFRFECA